MTAPRSAPASFCVYDWISAEDVLRHALACFYAECRESDTYRAQHHAGDGLDLHGRREFAEHLGEAISRRLYAALPLASPSYAFPDMRASRDIHRAHLVFSKHPGQRMRTCRQT